MKSLQLGDLLVDFSNRSVRATTGNALRLGSRASEILFMLAERRNAYVSRPELMQAVWPGIHVDEANLSVQVSALRKALAAHSRSVVQSSSGRGYRLVYLDESPSVGAGTVPGQAGVAVRWSVPPRREMFGRHAEIDAVVDALKSGSMVSVCGPIGIGKSAVALEAAHVLASSVAASIAWIDLTDPVPHAMLAANLTEWAASVGGRRGANAFGPSAAKEPTVPALLVLDNCGLVDGSLRDLIAEFRRSFPWTSILVTSLVRLGMQGEQVITVDRLQVPGVDAEISRSLGSPALLLFLNRLDAEMPWHPVDAGFLADAARICRRLDGVPLGLELAARAAARLGWDEFVEEAESKIIDPRVVAIDDAHGDSLTRSIAWNYELLPPHVQPVFRALAVFVGGFSVEAARDVVGDEAGSLDIAQIIEDLAGKSLLTAIEGGRYVMLATQRAFATKLCRDLGEWEGLSLRHARFFGANMEWVWLKRRAASDAEMEALLSKDQENRRSATAWAVRAGYGELALANLACLGTSNALDAYDHQWAAEIIGKALTLRADALNPAEFDAALVLVLLRLPSSALVSGAADYLQVFDNALPTLREQGRADILIPALINKFWRTRLFPVPSKHPEMDADLQDIHALIKESGLAYEMPRLLRVQSTAALSSRRYDRALDLIRESIALNASAGQMDERLNGRINEIVCLRSLGRHREALSIGFEELEVGRPSPVLTAYFEGNIAASLIAIGDNDGAKIMLRRAFSYFSNMDTRFFIAGQNWLLVHAAKCCVQEDRFEDGALLLGAGSTNRHLSLPDEADTAAEVSAKLAARLGPARAAALMEQGRSIDFERIMVHLGRSVGLGSA